MKILRFLALILVSLSASAFADPLIALVGDSTVAAQATSPGAGPARGWGQILPEFFTDQVTFKNAAANGRSSKSFIDEGRWEDVIAMKPSYVFILWGTNDNNADPARHTDPATTFREYLRRYVDESVAAGAVPVFVTPSALRMFAADGLIKNSLEPYAVAMREVAAEKKVALIDLNAQSIELYNKLGPDETQKLAAKEKDTAHFNEEGARTMAKFIVDAIPATVPGLKPYLVPSK